MTFDHTVGIMFFFNISPSMLISCSVQRFGVGGIYHSAKTIEVNDRKTSVCVCVPSRLFGLEVIECVAFVPQGDREIASLFPWGFGRMEGCCFSFFSSGLDPTGTS